MKKITIIDCAENNKIKEISFAVQKELKGIINIEFEVIQGGNYYYDVSFNKDRNQCDINEIIYALECSDNHIVVMDADLYATDLNWCFGGYAQAPHNCIVLSERRIENDNHYYDMFAHELGHMLGVCNDETRESLEESLGLHCTNSLCVMQQKLTVRDSLVHCSERHHQKAPLFCDECLEELKNRYCEG